MCEVVLHSLFDSRLQLMLNLLLVIVLMNQTHFIVNCIIQKLLQNIPHARKIMCYTPANPEKQRK